MAEGMCSIEGCGRVEELLGRMCRKHYRQWRKTGNPLPTRKRRSCTVEGCGKPAHGLGLCGTHYDRMRKRGTTDAPHPRVRPTCSVEDCQAEVEARGWCARHYERFRRTGSTADPVRERKVCQIPGCGKFVQGHGLCGKHYWRLRQHGDPLHERQPIKERLLAYMDRSEPDGCWPWTGFVDEASGYARTSRPGTDSASAHRVVYETFVGPIPDGYTIDHMCHKHDECAGGSSCPHRRCCNPAHMETALIVPNAMRGNSPAAINARKTHCIHGHEYTPENTMIANGHRRCRTCANAYRRKRYHAKKVLATAA